MAVGTSEEEKVASITLRKVTKLFGNVKAVDNVSLDIVDGEVVCLLGPSGCGKTTTLRLIAGFERPTAGEVWIGGKLVSSANYILPPEHRNLGMVFQNYAVWPHMNVFNNVAYPLKLRRLPKAEIHKKVMHVLTMVGLKGLEKRYPEQLSGGQQQRVALARALVMEPDALLLDEPLSNLDAKLREKLRFEIMDLHRQLRMTLVYVTHDQSEAMVLADRIVIMNQGKVIQVGSPWEIYREPADPFVADFIGLANFIPAVLVEEANGEGIVKVGSLQQHQMRCSVLPRPGRALPTNGVIFVRPEEVDLLPAGGSELTGTVTRITFLGSRIDVRVEVNGDIWRVEAPAEMLWREGDRVSLVIKRAIFFETKKGGER